MTSILSLDSYRRLGRSGLRVSPLALGTMTFGSDWGWGADRDETKKIFDAYVERGGNFIDTANAYTNGTAEQLVGEFAHSRRDQLVIATKYTMATRQRGLDIAGVVKGIAAEIGTTPSRVALAWTLLNPAVTAPIVGARSLTQLDDNLSALDVQLDPGQQASLQDVSAIELGFPHDALRRIGLAG